MTQAAAPFDPSLRQSVAAMVRRRVPASDADDVAQTVLCDALAAERVPHDPVELRRFVSVIARHKIADFHRRARVRGGAIDPAEALARAAASPAPIEARALLRRVIDSLARSDRDRQTLEWLVREHDGEQLSSIAEEVGLPAPSVRQRVSRLRRALRAQWAHALAILFAVGACAAIGDRARHASRDADAITADPAVDPGARVLALAQGLWRVDGDARAVDVRVRGRRVDVSIAGVVKTRTIAHASALADGSYAVDLRDEGGAVQRATVVVAGDRMTVTTQDGRLSGTARLYRVR
ncbi:MAG: sigma-70 family RNA polymerase sigma factor [Labilithrix sp.]|nr:sigma-70 family RNA polymerase sigma factor [Labilithrix sp.]